MRYLSFSLAGRDSWGVLDGDRIVELAGADPAPADLGALVRADAATRRTVAALAAALVARGDVARLPLRDVRVLPPFRPPKNVFCLGLNYAEHARESGVQRPTAPVYFTKCATALTGAHDDITLGPGLSAALDWEVELGVVLGEGGRAIPRERALAHVFGYTVVNDISMREVQHGRGGQWFLGKNLAHGSPIGPWIVTADEVPDPQTLDLELRVNGAVKQRANTADMIFPVAEIIADLSRYVDLEPGDIIATGTPPGVGAGRRPPEFLRHGDVVEAEIPRFGTLRNVVREG